MIALELLSWMSLWSKGSPKATVLPVPVLAHCTYCRGYPVSQNHFLCPGIYKNEISLYAF